MGSISVVVHVALAHTDLGWAWQGIGWEATLPRQSRDAFATHVDHAAEILAEHKAQRADSPLLASAQCALLPGHPEPERRVADTYQALNDLDIGNPRDGRASAPALAWLL